MYWACNYVCFNSKPGFHYVNISKYIIHTFQPDTNLFIRRYLNLSFLVIMILFPVEYFSENVSDSNSDFKVSQSAISLSRATISTIHLELCEIINIMHYSRIKCTKNFHLYIHQIIIFIKLKLVTFLSVKSPQFWTLLQQIFSFTIFYKVFMKWTFL